MVRKAYKYRIGLTNGQQRIVHAMLEEARWVYNQTLAMRKDVWEQRQDRSSATTASSILMKRRLLPRSSKAGGWPRSRHVSQLLGSQALQIRSTKV